MLFTIPTRSRPASLSIQYQPRSSIFENKHTKLQNRDVTMQSINTSLSNKYNSRQTTGHTMQLLFQARKPKSVSSSKQRVANILVEEYKKPTPQEVVFPFFPSKNNNMTLEKMPVLDAGKETYVFQEGIRINSETRPQSQPKPQQTWFPSWERDDKEKVIKNEKVHVELPKREIPVHDIVVNNTPKPIVPWKPTWER